ncbi:hypothetical protein EJ110_NYTH36820 [Nymphaea thermarum]|nr:hypothetical protein EJ110_NYTH36820 [Nymphaea thermarum]
MVERGGKEEKKSVALPPALRSPKDVINRIFCQLDCVDLLHCSLVCKYHFTLWKTLIHYSSVCTLPPSSLSAVFANFPQKIMNIAT